MLAVRRLVRYFGAGGWMDPAATFILGAFILLIRELINGLVVGQTTLDIQLHDTLFVIAHSHLTIGFVVIFFFFAGVYEDYPRVTGRILNAPMGYVHYSLK